MDQITMNEDTTTLSCPVCFATTSTTTTTTTTEKETETETADSTTSSTRAPPEVRFVQGPCQHALCWECMHIVVNAATPAVPAAADPTTTAQQRWPPLGAADVHLSAPTLGRCPICRLELSLFDVVYSHTQQPVYSTTRTTTVHNKPGLALMQQSPSTKVLSTSNSITDSDTTTTTTTNNNNNNTNNTTPPTQTTNSSALLEDPAVASITTTLEQTALLITTTPTIATIRTTMATCPLYNKIYVPYRGRIGQFSFHWDWEKVQRHPTTTTTNNSTTEPTRTVHRPFLNFTEVLRTNPDDYHFDDGTLLPKIKYFDSEKCFFHAPTRTFHGTIQWTTPQEETKPDQEQDPPRRPVPTTKYYQGCATWQVILAFSHDYRYIADGRIHHQRARRRRRVRRHPSRSILPSPSPSLPLPIPGVVPSAESSKQQQQQQQQQTKENKNKNKKNDNIYTKEQQELMYQYPMDGRWTVIWDQKKRHTKKKKKKTTQKEEQKITTTTPIDTTDATESSVPEQDEPPAQDENNNDSATELQQPQQQQQQQQQQHDHYHYQRCRAEIIVRNNAFQQGGYMFYFNYHPHVSTTTSTTDDADEEITVHWPKSRHKQTIVPQDLIQNRHTQVNTTDRSTTTEKDHGHDTNTNTDAAADSFVGVTVGSKIRWILSDPKTSCRNLVWIRQTLGPLPPLQKVTLFGTGPNKVLYEDFRHHRPAGSSVVQRMLGNGDGRSSSLPFSRIPKYVGTSIFGNVFTKQMFLGSASYHFISPTKSYISYRHPACRDLPLLDDGSPLPTVVYFRNVIWDSDARKFSATIEWEEDFGTSWNDNVRWTVTMYFDSEYMIILKGGIQCEWCQERRARPRPPRPQPRHRPRPVPVYVPPPEGNDTNTASSTDQQQKNEEWVMSGYGHDQVYVNAASLERYRTLPPATTANNTNITSNNWDRSNIGSSDGSEIDQGEEVIDYTVLEAEHRKRLEKEHATTRSIGFVSHLFQLAAVDENVQPIDFGLI